MEEPATMTRLLTLEQAAEQLQLSTRELRAAMAAGALAHVVLGKQVRIHPQDLRDFCHRHTIKAWTPTRMT